VGSVFLDTDVILDLFIRREPHHGLALRLFSRLRRSKTKCVTSPVVVANLYYLLAKLRSKAYAL
jgi:predicted nucleic acid-binding protein